MNHYESNSEQTGGGEIDERDFYCLLDEYQPVFFEREGLTRVLGEGHPVVKLMEEAVESLDTEELKVALAAYEALPEWVVHRIKNPWVGHPPPAGTRQRLREEHAPELVGETSGREPVGCYLQIDARNGDRDEVHWAVDADGHVVDPAIVYDLRVHKTWPVRLQVAEGSDKRGVLELLSKISETLERDWDELIDPERHLKLLEEPASTEW